MAEKKLNFKDAIRMVFKDANPITNAKKSFNSEDIQEIQPSTESKEITATGDKKVCGAVTKKSIETSNEFEGKDFNDDTAVFCVQSLCISDSKQNASDNDSDFKEFKRACELVKDDSPSALLDTVQFCRTVPPWNKAFKNIFADDKPADIETQSSHQWLAKNSPTEQRQENFGSTYGRKPRGRLHKRTEHHDDSEKRTRGSRQQQMSRDCRGRATYHESLEKVHDVSRSGENYWYNDQDHDSKKRPRGSRHQQRSRVCHCCKANRNHLTHLKKSNRFEEYQLNDFDGSGVDCFKNSNLAPQLLPSKVVKGNRVYYYATPNHRYLEGFVADFLKPENRKPTVLTEEQKAALEPDEYWDD